MDFNLILRGLCTEVVYLIR